MSARAPDDPRCKDCPSDHEPGRARCAACADRHRLASAERAEERRAAGVCVTCGGKVVKKTQYGKPSRYCKAHNAYYLARAKKK